MFFNYWSTTGGPDYRRYTVAEGDTPLPLGSTCGRKKLGPAEENDGQEVRRSCTSRPNPEGLLTWEMDEAQGAGLQRLCQRCHIVTSQLNRQASAVAERAALKDPVYASSLLRKLRLLQWPHHGDHAPDTTCCEICGTSYHQLRLQAQYRALDQVHSRVKRQKLQEENQQQWGGAPQGWGGVQSTYLGGGGTRRLATVTPLPLNTHHYLEGVWRVSCCTEENPSAGRHMTLKTSSEDATVKPEAHSVATQTAPPSSAAATFFMRAAQKLTLLRRRKSPTQSLAPLDGTPQTLDSTSGPLLLYTGGFSGALRLAPPTIPPCLLRAGSKMKDAPRTGKVRVMVRVSSIQSSESPESSSFLKVDCRKNQLTLCKTSSSSSSSSRPQTFTFDGVFPQDASQAEVCSGALVDVLQSVVNGADGCVFCFGPANLGKTYTMIGRECSAHSLGVIPTAISWLFRVLEERRQKCGTLFSVGVSAVEISGQEETLTDLLAKQEDTLSTVCLTEDPLCGCQLQNQTDIVACNVEQAASFLDSALAARTSQRDLVDGDSGQSSHFLFTLHVKQERKERSGKMAAGARSHLHLLDLGSCETNASRSQQGGGAQGLTLSALGNIILALANGAKHVPYRDRKLTMLLLASLGNINCCTTMLVHVCDSRNHFLETLTTLQLATRVLQLRRRSLKLAASSSGGDSSCEDAPPLPLHHCLVTDVRRSSSCSRQSCDAVIDVGSGGPAVLDLELNNHEGSASFIPIIPSHIRKQANDTPQSDGDHFKCSTFAELQERLDFINGGFGPSRATMDMLPSRAWSQSLWESLSDADHQQDKLAIGLDEEKLSSVVSRLQPGSLQDSQYVVRENALDPELSVGDALSRNAPEVFTGWLPAKVWGQRWGEDELVYTLDEEFPHSLDPDNGHPPNLLHLPPETLSSPPVSIISSINDEYDAYTLHQLGEAVDLSPTDGTQTGVDLSSDWAAGVSSITTTYLEEENTLEDTHDISDTQLCHSLEAFPTDSSIESHHTHPTSMTLCPTSTDSFGTMLVPALHRAIETNLSSEGHYSPQRTCHSDPPDICDAPRSGTDCVSCQRTGRKSKGVPWLTDGFDKSRRKRGTLIKLPQLPQDATTLGSVSTPHRTKSKHDHDGISVVRMLRLSSLGKKNGQKSSLVQVSKPGNDCCLVPPDRRSSQEEKMRTEVPPSGSKMSSSTGKFLKTFTSEETTCAESSSARRSSSTTTPRADAECASAFRVSSVGLVPAVSHARKVQCGHSNNSPSSVRLKVRRLLSSRSKSPSSSPKNSDVAGSDSRLPPTGRSHAHARTGTKTRRRTIMRAASSIISELTTNRKHIDSEPGNEAISSGMSGSGGSPLSGPLPSPYTKITAPQGLRHRSSMPSNELPPATHCAVPFRHSDGSSGYESMRHDSETTSSTSSAQNSTNKRRTPSNNCRTPKPHKKRENRFLRGRLVSANSPNTRSVGGQWVDLSTPSGSIKQNFQLKVYEIDDVERLQGRTEAVSGPQALLDLAIWLRMLEKQQQQIQDLRNKHQQLTEELQEAKTRIMVPPSRWCGQFDVDQDLDPNSKEYLEVLTRVTAQLEIYVNLCKSRVLMETSFDITSWRTTTQPEGRPDEEEDMAGS